MAQKTKVKELVGRGLDSYHTKSLQQINRIEKKNKEQNHKISILSNELDNDYLTKTEEGSVISLEHSKEGMIYLDELQGNTLVNYCTDGSKELTLNGDIDVEGTFVTTTEGVDNGKVDVMCEGNTLVNLVNKIQDYKGNAYLYGWQDTPSNCEKYEWVDNGVKIYSTLQDTSADRYFRSTPYENGIFKPNRTYIVRMNVSASDLNVSASILRCFYGNGKVFMSGSLQDVENGVFVKKATTSSDLNVPHSMISLDYTRPLNTEGWVSFQNVMVIDVTDLPSYQQDVEYWRNMNYFEGMKSVGQDDVNGHKIEILSRNKNLFDINSWKDATVSSGQRFDINNNTVTILGYNSDTYTKTGATGSSVCSEGERKYLIEVKPNTTYTLSMEVEGETSRVNYVQQYNENYANLGLVNYGSSTNDKVTFTTKPNCKYVGFRIGVRETGATLVYSNILLEEGSQKTNYVNYNTNKKEILLNEPLRGLPNGVKDRFVKIGGKWFKEKKCEEIVFDGSDDEKWSFKITEPSGKYSYKIDPAIVGSTNGRPNGICDKFTFVNWNSNPWNYKSNCISILANGVYVYTDFTTLSEFKTWLQSNPFTLIYELPTPKYEPLEIEPILSCYTDITHISNNSIIPCNMKIKNSGYNAIIKPSTLYTVALDTNKSGTIGINLGGAKGTTTNNVLKLTTPATLADDSLRIYGKGIKGSKVRLLEGDKTNWIPSHFEGMKSSFEDKFDATDNTYKMEILSNNENCAWNVVKNGDCIFVDVLLDNNTTYTINTSSNSTLGGRISLHPFGVRNSNNNPLLIIKDWTSPSIRTFTTPSNIGGLYTILLWKAGNSNGLTDDYYITLKRGNDATKHIERSINKIQFSSIEPLRSVGDIKDKFVFKDGRLLIERNIHRFIADGTYVSHITKNSYESEKSCACLLSLKSEPKHIRTDKLNTVQCDKYSTYVHLDAIWGSKTIHQGISNVNGTYDFAIREYNSKTTINPSDTHDTLMSKFRTYLNNNPIEIEYVLVTPTYEEIPFELQKIILEGYENGTLFIDTNIPPTSIVTYAGETPIVKATKLNKTEVLNNTNDINDNIIPYLMDMDYRVVCLQLQSEGFNGGVAMARLFGGAYEMLKRDIQSKRYSVDEYRYRLDAYLSANKITEEEYNKLGDMLNE